jgi:hypothetical protein
MAANSSDDKGRVLLSAVWLLYMLVLLGGVVWLGVWERKVRRGGEGS